MLSFKLTDSQVYVGFGGGFSLIVSQGVNADPGIKKLLLGACFTVMIRINSNLN